MARQRKPAPIPLKKVRTGDAFLAPMQDGRLSVCRVLRAAPDAETVLVGASTWIGTEPPDLDEPQLRELLRPTHHLYDGEPYLLNVWDPVPATFTRLGVIPPTNKESKLSCPAFSGWDSFPLQVFLQWRWDHERDKVIAEDAAKKQAEAEARAREERAYKPLPPQTLEDLRRQTPLPRWTGWAHGSTLREARRIVRETIDALIELGPDATEPARLDVLQDFITRFNVLDGQDGLDIDTIAREELCELVDDLGALVGLDDYDLSWDRDW
ncbi:MAG: hypothetical protein L0Z62_29175 [Gemmataceae bacterium]|nr:hypothetical protein [Gemmataceae bacterium]